MKWDGVSFVNNVHYGEEGVRVWRSYKIGRGKFIPWSKFHVPDQDEVPTLECSAASENIKANFVPIKPRRAEVAKTSQKHQDSTDEGTDDSSEESRTSTTKNIFFCSEEGCIKSYQRHSSLQKHLECHGRHKYVLEYETLYDRAVLGYASRLEKGPGAVPELRDTESTPSSSVASVEMGWALKQSRSRNIRFTDEQKFLIVYRYWHW